MLNAEAGAGKLIKGRKRHILVDTLGLLLVVVVTAAAVQDRDGARILLKQLPGSCKKLRKVWVDGGYRGQLLEWVKSKFRFCLKVVLRSDDQKGFVLLPRRWVVERTFAWLGNHRRLSKDYERFTKTSQITTARGGGLILFALEGAPLLASLYPHRTSFLATSRFPSLCSLAI